MSFIDKVKEEAKAEAKRFLKRVAEYEKAIMSGDGEWSYYPKESGAVRRASMDLTRALAKLRRYGA